jgi:hypothetical protein
MWKLTFEAPAGKRNHQLGLWITTMTKGGGGNVSWYSKDEGKWVANAVYGSSNCFECTCIRSFKKHLRKHPELKGEKVCLVSRYHGLDVTANWVESNK